MRAHIQEKVDALCISNRVLIKTIFCTLLNVIMALEANGQSLLPHCQTNLWLNCFGTTIDSVEKYIGEFGNGMSNGQGTYTFLDGEL